MGMVVHDFRKSLREGQKGERTVTRYLRSKGYEVVKAATMVEQKRGIDLRATRDGKTYTVEVKRDTWTAKTGNVAVEYWSDADKRRPGWARYCEADFLFYIAHPTHMHIIPLERILTPLRANSERTIVDEWIECGEYRIIQPENRGWQSECVLVPEAVLAPYIARTVVL